MPHDTRRRSLASVVQALEWTAEQRGDLTDEHALGKAVPSPAGSGRYEVDLTDQRWDETRHRQLRLRFPDGTGRTVDRVVRSGPGLLVVEIDGAPGEGTPSLVASYEPAEVPRALAALFGQVGQRGMVDPVLDGHLDEAPSDRRGRSDLNDQQRRAVATLTGDGVHLVWSPPGTGATTVVAETAGLLADEGRTVLVVSPSARAVDDAALAIGDRPGVEPGQVVRLGVPQSEGVADHPWLTFHRAVAERRRPVAEHRDRAERRLAALDDSELAREWDEVSSLLDRADLGALQDAWRRVQGPERIARLESALVVANEELAVRRGERKRRRAEARRVEGLFGLDPAVVWQRIEDARMAEEEAGAAVEARDEQRRNTLAARDAAIHRLHAIPSYRVLERRRLGAEVDQHQANLATLEEAREAARKDFDERHSTYHRLKAELSHHLPPECDAEWWSDLQARRAGAAIAVQQAESAVSELEAEIARLRSDLDRVRADPPTPLDHQLVEEISPRLPELRARREELSGAHHDLQDRRAEVLEEMAAVYDELGRVARAVVADAVVVLATPAALAAHPELAERRFDTVLVDRAARAEVAVVVGLAALADRAVGLIGDAGRPGPRYDPRPGLHSASSLSLPPEVRHWLTTEPFQHFGVSTAARAEDQRGCVALTRQYRLGKATEGLLNRLVYADALWSNPRWTSPVDDGRGELVLIDTSTLARSQRWIVRDGPSRHWPLGLVLTARLMELHGGIRLGVSAPNQSQADLLRALVADSGRGDRVVAGSVEDLADGVHEAVVLDLVSDRWPVGLGPGPGGNGDDGPDPTLRAAVGALGASLGRVYLVADGRGLSGPGRAGDPEAGPPDPLLAALSEQRGRTVDVVDAVDLLDDERLVEGDAPLGSSPGDVGKLVRVHSKESFYDRLEEVAGHYRQRIDVWSPQYSERRIRTMGRRWAGAARRGRIHARVLPARTNDEKAALAALERTGVTVAGHREVHERLLIGDGRLVLWGSLDVLAANRRTELMAELESPLLARLLRARADGYPA